MTYEPLLKKATIKAIDGISRKVAKSERAAEGAVGKLLKHWNSMDETEKEQVIGIVIATATTAVTALVALKSRSSRKSVAKKTARAGVKRIAKALK
jgi:hypothetical protein